MRKQDCLATAERLVQWFDHHQRDLPWRRNHTPYETWISEIMLQQTQIKTMLPYYDRWMRRFPDLPSVALAPEEVILKHWEGLGYYSRARNIHKAAQIVMQDLNGIFPQTYEEVIRLPGIGRYTAGAIMSFAFNQEYPAVDGNVERIFSRIFDLKTPVKTTENQKFIWSTAQAMIPKGKARRFNQSLMDLGALVCLPRRTFCGECPVQDACKSFQRGTMAQRPVPVRRKPPVPIEVAIGVLVRDGKLLIQKRPASGLMPHLWEFPGGKIEEGETPEEALVREFREELELSVRCLDKIAVLRHGYTSFKVVLHAFFCELEDPGAHSPVLHSAVDARWVYPHELRSYAFPAANKRLIALLDHDRLSAVLEAAEAQAAYNAG